jgi:type I restriction enzyme S subunit
MESETIREYRPLRECTSTGSVSYGIVQPGSHVEKGVPIIRVNNINDGSLDVTSPLKVDPQIDEKHHKTRLEGGEVLLSLVGTTGQCVVAGSELKGWNVARAIAVIKPAQGISAEWLSICLKSQAAQHYLDNRANTTVQKTLNLKDVREIPIMRVSETEERYILEWWTTLNDKIELNQKMNATLEAMAQALFKSWFVDFDPVIDNALAAANPIPEALAPRAEIRRQALVNGTANREAELFSKAFVESDFGLIPNDYEIRTIEQCCTFVSRGVTPKYELGSGRFIINQKVNRGAELDLSNLKELTNSLTVSADKHAQSHDVLVNCLGEGTLGRVHFYNGESGIYAVDQHMTICRPNTPEFGLYLYQYLASPVGQDRIESAKTGSTGMTMFNIKKVRSFQIPLPSRKSLKAYGNETLDFYKKIQKNRNQNLTLTALRDTLLPKLISGELRIPEAEQLTEKALA